MKPAILLLIYVASFYQEPSIVQAQCNDGDIRLEGDESEVEGRVEVCMREKWSTVCRDHWGSKEASVACRQLGYSDKNVANVSFGQVCGGLQTLDVKCNGSEKKLVDCNHKRNKNCNHSNDVGVRCQPYPPQNVAAVVSSTSVSISWRPPQNEIVPSLYYVICSATINASSATYKNKIETQVENSTLSVTMPRLLSSTTYICCVSTGADILYSAACSSVTTAKTSNCSAVGGGLGALVVILVLVLIGAICIIVYLKFQQKIEAFDSVNEQHPTSTGNPLKEDRALHNPSYGAHDVEVPPSRYRNSSGIHNPSSDAQYQNTEIPPKNPNSSQYSTPGAYYEPVEQDCTGTEGHEYANMRR